MKPISVFGSYAYEDKFFELVAYDYKGICEVFEKIEELRGGHYCLGYLTYETHKALSSHTFRSSTPLCYFAFFRTRTPFVPPKSQDTFAPLSPQWISREKYLHKVEQLREQIKEGNTYQGNLTTILTCTSTLSPYEIFLSLLSKQDTAYRCFLPTPHGDVISFSPELFFSIKGEEIITKPMKGTMPRGRDEKEDEANKAFLQRDIKNRSENVMIVDLLRNDLGKIASNISVPKLFEVESYPTLFQMTSTITAKLKNTKLLEVFEALFPCGSISGAPKKSTLEILQSLEDGERGVYCGALGVVYADEAHFSIPIRTFWHHKGRLSYGVGSGIVWDSDAQSEYQELKTKMSFLSPHFSLFETMLYRCGNIPLLTSHLARLRNSAEILGFEYPSSLEDELRGIELEGEHIVRVVLEREGSYTLGISAFTPHTSDKVLLQERRGRSDLYAHKTTFRPWAEGVRYDEVFDVIFYDERGRITEGSRSNILLEIGGKLYTPKYEGQLLRGVYRESLLKQGEIIESQLTIQDLKNADKIFCINSVRGRVEVNLIGI